ncbi:hypothetical protein ABEB36_011101 [Hypothenemus hampei]|uniref:Uncharacterized protein n=1 Tax=Hypothenemus hampei TaxID=57062 RepID=A0ABD1EER3_HYPHA
MTLFLLLLSLTSVALALPPVGLTNCVPNCHCDDIYRNILNVVGCEGPLTINSTLFNNLDRSVITVARFSNVVIDQIKEDAFKKMLILQDVIIEHAQIGSIDAKAFDSVKKVKFADCGFEVSPNLSSENLEQLHFGDCKLDVIPKLDRLYNLTFLNLSGNYIQQVDFMTFAEVFNLETLYLSNNEISRLPANLFVNNVKLRGLHLDNNPLKMFYLNISNILETLSIRNCFLSTFDLRSTQRLTSLIELNLSNNRIKSLYLKDLAPMAELQIIDLSNNNLSQLEDDIFSNNLKLQRITLDGNKMDFLPKFNISASDAFETFSFSCQSCGLKSLHPDTFKNMPLIYNLNLAYNDLISIEKSLVYIGSLRILDVSYNNIRSLSEAFNTNKNLETLNIAGNPLNELNPSDFALNKAMKKIDASNCKLDQIWSNRKTSLSELKKLLLAGNHLKSISIEDFKIVPRLQQIDLHDNPLKLNDQLCDVINYLQQNYVSLIEYPKNTTDNGLLNDIDYFTPNGWADLHQNKCRDASSEVQEIDILSNLEDDKEDLSAVLKKKQLIDLLMKKNDDLNAEKLKEYDYYYEDDDDYAEDDDDDDDEDQEGEDISDSNDAETPENVAAEVVNGSINFARVSYILSVTSVFVLTALAVLIMAVVVTLCVLRRNTDFNLQKANLPRFKIPRWEAQFSEKKHSGSVYRPLSEDLSGPKTPKMSRYDFSATPTVHGTSS